MISYLKISLLPKLNTNFIRKTNKIKLIFIFNQLKFIFNQL